MALNTYEKQEEDKAVSFLEKLLEQSQSAVERG